MPQQEKLLHQISEGAALFLLSPYLLYLAIKMFKLGSYINGLLLILIVLATLAIDGYLLYKWTFD